MLAVVTALALALLCGCGPKEDTTMHKGTSLSESASESDGLPEADAASAGARVSFVDVGKGDCILVQAGESAALIDTGYDDTSGEVIAYLRSCGVERLDCLVITHYDKDHVGGLRAIGQAIPIDAVYLPNYTGADKPYRTVKKAVDDLGLPARQVTAELVIPLGSAELSIFPSSVTFVPDANGDEGNDNDLSLVATLSAGSDSYLFAGDLEEEGIEAFLEAGHGAFDVLKMPHHGEKSSNTDELLDDVKPQVVVITDGEDDPAEKKTLKLLKGMDVDVYRTSTDGTIVVEGDGAGGYVVSTDDR